MKKLTLSFLAVAIALSPLPTFAQQAQPSTQKNTSEGIALERKSSTNDLAGDARIQGASLKISRHLFKRWTHSSAEDRGDILVYRPKNYPLPRTRGRTGLEFFKNGRFIYHSIAPTDGILPIPGRWSIQQPNMVKMQFPGRSIPSYTLTILECNEQILRVRKIATK